MKKALLLLVTLIGSISAWADFGLWINNPQMNWQAKTQGYITEPEILITPKGVYAEVEFTFKMHCQNSYNNTDTLESVLDFELPANSFIHNSWLWLDATTIIQAAIIDKGRAIQIYENIVKRRRDPSLLIKTGANNYRLNVFPLTKQYPRKVKIVYSVPFNWLTNKVNFELPTEILNTSTTKQNLTLKIKNDNTYSQPYFTEQFFSNYVIGSTATETTLQIPSTAYENGLTLNYQTSLTNGVLLNTFATGNNAGIYQMVIDPVNVLGQAQSRNVVFILDHSNNGPINNFAKVKSTVQSYLLNNFNQSDSFNIFYTDNFSTTQKTSANWAPTTASAINGAFSALPATVNTNTALQYEALLKTALSFAASKPGAYTQVVLISSNTSIMTQALADTTFNHINAHLGGFHNKIHVINNSNFSSWSGTNSILANELLYSKLTLASSGNYYKYTTNTSTSTYTIDIKNILRQVSLQLGNTISAYSITLPITGGFPYAQYDIRGNGTLSTSVPYVETGKFIGNMNTGNVGVQFLSGSGVVSTQLNVSTISYNTSHSMQAWSRHYIEQLSFQNTNNIFTNEIIDTSIRNRVLCDYTAFLALENGDTVMASVNANGPGGGSGGGTSVDDHEIANNTIKCYPNPFTSEITIEFIKPVQELMIFDLSGRMILTVMPKKEDKKFVWNGKNASGTDVPTGIYFIKARTVNNVVTYKILKQ
ncbi:MAG TPA: VIT domain-containing protein [Flavipsychrobacter sp.]|nr:VIT domain-containing protein [Flavipsychrobacter sp.]